MDISRAVLLGNEPIALTQVQQPQSTPELDVTPDTLARDYSHLHPGLSLTKELVALLMMEEMLQAGIIKPSNSPWAPVPEEGLITPWTMSLARCGSAPLTYAEGTGRWS